MLVFDNYGACKYYARQGQAQPAPRSVGHMNAHASPMAAVRVSTQLGKSLLRRAVPTKPEPRWELHGPRFRPCGFHLGSGIKWVEPCADLMDRYLGGDWPSRSPGGR